MVLASLSRNPVAPEGLAASIPFRRDRCGGRNQPVPPLALPALPSGAGGGFAAAPSEPNAGRVLPVGIKAELPTTCVDAEGRKPGHMAKVAPFSAKSSLRSTQPHVSTPRGDIYLAAEADISALGRQHPQCP